MKSIRSRNLAIAALVLLALAVGLYVNMDSLAVSYHKRWIKMIQPTGQPFEHHQQALLRLGSLVRKDFALKHWVFDDKAAKEFMQRVDRTTWREERLWTITTVGTNATLVQIVSYHEDIPKWEELFREFDSTKER